MKMNKKAETAKWIIIALVIGAAIFLLYYYGMGPEWKTLREHAEPVDISKEEEGKGIEIFFYDDDGNPITIPDWFKVMGVSSGVVGAIVEHPPAPTCTLTSECPGWATNPNIACWESKCVLVDVASMAANVAVTNGASFDFNDVYISAASPLGFENALPMGIINKQELPGGGTIGWMSSQMNFETEGWIGTTQTFSATVHGTNSYDGSGHDSSDSITLVISADPTGTFSVVIETGVPV